jgi:hypothetical protein
MDDGKDPLLCTCDRVARPTRRPNPARREQGGHRGHRQGHHQPFGCIGRQDPGSDRECARPREGAQPRRDGDDPSHGPVPHGGRTREGARDRARQGSLGRRAQDHHRARGARATHPSPGARRPPLMQAPVTTPPPPPAPRAHRVLLFRNVVTLRCCARLCQGMGRPKEHDEQTRAQLLEAAGRLLAAEGPAALTVRRLADEVGTTTPRRLHPLRQQGGPGVGHVPADGRHARAPARSRGAQQGSGRRDPSLTLAYRESALTHPNLYPLIFGNAVPGFRPRPEAIAHARRGFARVSTRSNGANASAASLAAAPTPWATRCGRSSTGWPRSSWGARSVPRTRPRPSGTTPCRPWSAPSCAPPSP